MNQNGSRAISIHREVALLFPVPELPLPGFCEAAGEPLCVGDDDSHPPIRPHESDGVGGCELGGAVSLGVSVGVALSVGLGEFEGLAVLVGFGGGGV